jgi:serine/threonine protein kinase
MHMLMLMLCCVRTSIKQAARSTSQAHIDGRFDIWQLLFVQRGLPEGDARWLFQQIALAVDFCHRLGIALRDIKVCSVFSDLSVDAGGSLATTHPQHSLLLFCTVLLTIPTRRFLLATCHRHTLSLLTRSWTTA